MAGNQHKEKTDSTRTPLHDPPDFTHLSEGGFHARLDACPGVAAVLFTAPHCGSCHVWKRLLPAALAGIAEHFFEVDAAEATGVVRYFGIFHLPTIYLYRDGLFHAELQCDARLPAIRQAALNALHAEAAEEP
ncbi:MAG: thioredoxin family protein [Thiobacillus sp.]